MSARETSISYRIVSYRDVTTGVNPAGDAGDTSPNILVGGRRQREYPPILLRTFGYSRPILVALRSLSLKPISFGYNTGVPLPHTTAFAGSSRNLELALTPLDVFATQARSERGWRRRNTSGVVISGQQGSPLLHQSSSSLSSQLPDAAAAHHHRASSCVSSAGSGSPGHTIP